MKIKNSPIVSKATNLPGIIVRTHLDNIYVQFLYFDRKDASVKISLLDYNKYITVSSQMQKYLNKKIQKLNQTNNNLENSIS